VVIVALTLLWDIQPHSVLVECILIGVEAAEGRVAFRPRAVSIRIHRGIVLMTKRKTSTRLALAVGFGTLRAYGFLLVTLELPLPASQAVLESVCCVVLRRSRNYQPVRDLISLSFWLSSRGMNQ